MRLDGFEWIDAGPDGGTWASDAAPWRGIVHATQSRNISAAVSAYQANGTPPHVTADAWARRRAQHIDTDRSAYAVKNLPGGVETNRLRALQVELVGFSEDPANLPESLAPYSLEALTDADKRWLGEEVFAPLMAAHPVRPLSLTMYGADCGWTLARADARQRLSFDSWTVFDGWCCHQHVPENDHWDPGALDLATILRYAAPPLTEDDPMPLIPLDAARLANGRWPRFDVVDKTANSCTVLVSPGIALLPGLDQIAAPKFRYGPKRGDDGTLLVSGLSSPPRDVARTPGNHVVLVCADGSTFDIAN